MRKKALSAIILTTATVVSILAVSRLSVLRADGTKTEKQQAVPEGEVAIDEKNFPDAAFREIVKGYDKDSSGGLSEQEIKAVDKIQCTSKNISTLEGIGYFIELTQLECSGNNLTSLDLSKNYKLMYLTCSNNQLTSLKLYEAPVIYNLNCSYNQLTTLDLSNAMYLQLLSCHYNQLTSLDVSENKKLFFLDCQHNQLTSLILGDNPNLALFGCSDNQLSTLDFRLCPKLIYIVQNTVRTLFNEDGRIFYYYKFDDSPETVFFDLNVTLIMPDGPIMGTVTGLKAASAGKNKVKLTWNAVGAAEGYLVYAQKDGKYGYVGMTTKGTTFTDTKALDSDYNYYWVFAYAKDDGGFMHAGACEKYVYAKGVTLAVTNLKASSVTGGVKLSWTASSGADGYLVYGIRPGGSYGYIGMTTKGTTYTDTKASKTDYTFYWVFPYHKAADGSMIVGGTAKYTYGRAK